ncbi:hypothetical protein D3C71_1404550 [compost metagenome]
MPERTATPSVPRAFFAVTVTFCKPVRLATTKVPVKVLKPAPALSFAPKVEIVPETAAPRFDTAIDTASFATAPVIETTSVALASVCVPGSAPIVADWTTGPTVARVSRTVEVAPPAFSMVMLPDSVKTRSTEPWNRLSDEAVQLVTA